MPTSHVPSKKITVSAIHKLFPLDLTQAERCFSHAANFAERSNFFFFCKEFEHPIPCRTKWAKNAECLEEVHPSRRNFKPVQPLEPGHALIDAVIGQHMRDHHQEVRFVVEFLDGVALVLVT